MTKQRRKDDEMSPGGEMLTGGIMATPAVANTVGGLFALPSLTSIMRSDTMRDDEQLAKFMAKHDLNREKRDNVKVKPGKHALHFEAEVDPDLKGYTAHIGAEHKHAAMHELGHTQADNPISRFRHWNINEASKTARAGGVKNFAKNHGHYYLDNVLAPFDETVAWKNAFKMNAAKGERMAMAATAAPALASYLARSAMTLGGLGLMGHGLYKSLTNDD